LYLSKDNHRTIVHFHIEWLKVQDIQTNNLCSNTKIYSQKNMDTNKIVLGGSCLELLAIMEHYRFLGKFGPIEAIAKAYKDTSRIVLPCMFPEVHWSEDKDS